MDHAGWPSLPADILLQVAALVPDADVHVMACASASWRDALNRDIHSMSFTWAARDPRHGHVCAVRSPHVSRLWCPALCSFWCVPIQSHLDRMHTRGCSHACSRSKLLKLAVWRYTAPAGEWSGTGSCCDVPEPAHCGAAPRNSPTRQSPDSTCSCKWVTPEGAHGPWHSQAFTVVISLYSAHEALQIRQDHDCVSGMHVQQSRMDGC